MNTAIGWPRSSSSVMSARSSAEMRGSSDAPNRLVSTSSTTSSSPSTPSRAISRARTSAAWAICAGAARLVGGHLDGPGHRRASDRRSRRWRDGPGRRPGLARRTRCSVAGTCEELVGGDIEAAALQLVEQSEAGAADVGGIAPAHLVGAVRARRRADAGRDRRRRWDRRAPRRPGSGAPRAPRRRRTSPPTPTSSRRAPTALTSGRATAGDAPRVAATPPAPAPSRRRRRERRSLSPTPTA